MVSFSDEVIAGAWKGDVAQHRDVRHRRPRPPELTVHEWGVFTIYSGQKYANAGLKAEWASLPQGFYRQFVNPHLRWVPAAWTSGDLFLH